MIPVQRDLDATRAALSSWLQHVLDVRTVDVSELVGFKAGQSGELLTFSARWRVGTANFREEMVVRIEPTASYQLFLDTNFEEQYRVIDALSRHTDVPMPKAIGFENDPAVLGERFFVMSKSAGRTGLVELTWMLDLGEAGRKTMWWNGLAAMAKLHQADWRALGLDFLDQQHRGADGVAQQLDYYRQYYEWVNGGVSYPAIEEAHTWLVANKPALIPDGIVWGDARRANQLFTDGLECCAILDLEQVCLGPPEADLAWWLRTETVMAERLGIECPSVEETVERYGELLGRPVENFDYYLVFAAYRISVLLIKLYQLRDDQPDHGGAIAGDRRLAEVLAKHAR